jgi:hypothetical protein
MEMFQERIMQALEQAAQDTRKAEDSANTIDGNSQHRKTMMTNTAPRETGKTAEEVDKLDEMLRHRVVTSTNIEEAVEELQDTMDQACRSSFKQAGKKGKKSMHKSLPWWTRRLTIQRKEVNTKGRRYQRKKDNTELREQKRNIPLLKSRIRNSHQTGEKQILERILQSNLSDESLERHIQDGSRKDTSRS